MRDQLVRVRRYGGGIAAAAALALATAVCADLTSPTGVNSVTIRFRNAPLPRPDTIFATAGDRLAPPIVVMLGQLEQPRARYVFSTTNTFVARPFAGGDSVEVVTRGSTNLVVTLVGTTIGNNVIGGATTQTADTIVLIAAAASNSVNPATVAFGTLGRSRQLTATSIGSGGQPIQGANIVWRSVNPAIVSVDAGTGLITSTGNGTTDVYAIFEGVDSAYARVTVTQTLDKYDLSTAAAANLRSINEIMPVTATAKDSLGNDLVAGSVAPPPPVFQSDDPGRIEIDPVSGVMTARGNTTTPVRITGTVGGVTRSDTLLATVRQVAVSISIQSPDTLRIAAVGGQILNVGVLAPDALGTQVPGSSITWTSSDPATVTVDGAATATITAQATGTVTITARADLQSDAVVVVVTNDNAPENFLVTTQTTSPPAGSGVVISAQLRDVNNNFVALPNVTVTWTKSNPSGSFSNGTSITNGAGIATITLNTHTVTGTSTTVTATSTISAATVVGTSPTITTSSGVVAQLAIVQAPSSSAQSGVPFLVQPSIRLLDVNGNPVNQANLSVTVTLISGGGVLTGATTVLSDATGLATFTDLAIFASTGAKTLQFSTSGAAPVTAPVTLSAGPASQLLPASSTSQSATVGTGVAVVPAVQVRDASNNPVANHPVVFAITSGIGSTSPASGSTINTNAAGVAALTSWTVGTTAGANAVSATAAGLAGSPVSFVANGTPGVVTAGLSSVVRTGPDNVPADGTASSMITVTLRDQYGNPVPGRVVSLDDAGSTSVITPVSATSNAAGQFTFSVTSTTAQTVTYTATANDPGPIVITQTAQVTFGNPLPTLSGIAPAAGDRFATLNVVFTGTGFMAGASSVNVGPGITVNSTTVNTATQITANITVTASAATGVHAFSVTNAAPGGGTTVTQSFTVSNPVAALTNLSPASAVQGESSRQVVLTGTGFVVGATVSFTPGTDITVNTTTVNSPTQITISISVAAGAAIGNRSVRVSNPPPGGGPSAPQTFTINSPPIPTFAGLAPGFADRLETLDVVLTGSGFTTGVTTVDFGSDITVNSITIDSPTQITANITIRAAAGLGARLVDITNSPAGGTSTPQSFTVNNPAPAIGTVSPNPVTGAALGLTVPTTIITGSGFVAGETTVDFVEGNATVGGTITVNSPTQITVSNINYPNALLFPSHTLRVTNGGRPPATRAINVTP